jgi:nitrate reductase delta subunit
VSALPLIAAALGYPDDALAAEREAIAREARDLPDGPGREALVGFLDWWAREPVDALRRRYVETFDLSRRTSLDMTYYTHGDRRQRGLALVALRRRYEAAGLELHGTELPDHLPVILEFAALDREAGAELLADVRPVVEVLRLALERAESPWAALVGALCASLPGLDDDGLAEVRRLAREGPPGESVGLEPFAPPEVMPAARPAASPACAGPRAGGAP